MLWLEAEVVLGTKCRQAENTWPTEGKPHKNPKNENQQKPKEQLKITMYKQKVKTQMWNKANEHWQNALTVTW